MTDPTSPSCSEAERLWLTLSVADARSIRYKLRQGTDHTRLCRTKAGRRKLRLLACACCRLFWPFLRERAQRTVVIAEQYADGLADLPMLARAYRSAARIYGAGRFEAFGPGLPTPDHLAGYVADPNAGDAVSTTVHLACALSNRCLGSEADQIRRVERIGNLLDEVLGNPFRPIQISSGWLAWQGGTIAKLAQSIYDDRDYDHLPVLADALEEAGCDNAAILDHCRGPAEHVRGCWVLDLILSKDR